LQTRRHLRHLGVERTSPAASRLRTVRLPNTGGREPTLSDGRFASRSVQIS